MNVGSITWEIARTGGFVAYVLLTASVAFGLALSLGWKGRRWTRFVTNEVHRFITLLALVFTAIHSLAVAVDPFIKMSPPDVLIPFVGTYRPLWVSAGIVATYLLIAIYLSERVRSRIGYTWWRRFHGLAFVAFVLALVHGVATGSDTRSVFGMAIYGASIAVVGGLLGLRLFPEAPKKSRPLGAAAAVLSAAAIVAFAIVGPLAPGWSVRAGGRLPDAVTAAATSTQAGTANSASNGQSDPNSQGVAGAQSGDSVRIDPNVQAGSNTQAQAPAGVGGLPLSTALPFTGRIGRTGGFGDDDGGGGGALVIQAKLNDSTAAFEVQVVPRGSGTAGGKMMIQTGDGSTCQGTISLTDTGLTSVCADANGNAWNVTLDVAQLSRRSITGTLTLAAAGGSGGVSQNAAPSAGPLAPRTTGGEHSDGQEDGGGTT